MYYIDRKFSVIQNIILRRLLAPTLTFQMTTLEADFELREVDKKSDMFFVGKVLMMKPLLYSTHSL